MFVRELSSVHTVLAIVMHTTGTSDGVSGETENGLLACLLESFRRHLSEVKKRTEHVKSENDIPPENSIPEGRASLESILCTEELQRRPSRPPDYKRKTVRS